eukprot:4034562-Amphidinium_carterae.1
MTTGQPLSQTGGLTPSGRAFSRSCHSKRGNQKGSVAVKFVGHQFASIPGVNLKEEHFAANRNHFGRVPNFVEDLGFSFETVFHNVDTNEPARATSCTAMDSFPTMFL